MDREYIIRGLNDSVVMAYYEYMVDAAVFMGAERERAETEMLAALQFEMDLANVSLIAGFPSNIESQTDEIFPC